MTNGNHSKIRDPNSKEEYFDNFLRDSNISKYVNIMSNEEVIKELLSPSKRPAGDDLKNKKERKIPVEAIADMLQSITTEAVTVSEMLEALYNTYGIKDEDKDIIPYIGNFIKIIHAQDYKLNLPAGREYWIVNPANKDDMIQKGTVNFKETPFAVPMKKPNTVPTNPRRRDKVTYKHDSTYGLLGKKLLGKTQASLGIYNVEEIAHAKIKEINDGVDDLNPINATIENKPENIIYSTKLHPSMAYILVDEANIRIGTRNSLELSTFFNSLSTVELSKCLPYFNATFILPSLTSSSKSKNSYKTASITQFFDGTPIGEDVTTNNYRKLEATFEREFDTKSGKKSQDAIVSNLSSFTMPQTVNNFTEKFVGHNSNVEINTDMNFLRGTSVHDITRPFMTIKSFTIDVAPTQGLMSFKTGKLSIVLHDKTRMLDIAPFIKPDLFGSFGAEIAVEYGWSHSDGDSKENFIGKFLNSAKTVEKYIITNSSFSMDNNGQINIDLSIAMRGPIDMRTVTLKSDPSTELKSSAVSTAETSFIQEVSNTTLDSNIMSNITVSEQYTSLIRSEISAAGTTTASIKKANFTRTNKIIDNIGKKYKGINSMRNLVEEFTTVNQFKKMNEKIKEGSGANEGFSFYENEESRDMRWDQIYDYDPNVSKLKSIYSAFADYLASVNLHYLSVKTDAEEAEDSLLAKIIGGLNNADPFYNKDWLKSFRRLHGDNPDKDGINIQGINVSSGPTSYVSLGAFITGLVGTHLACTGKFDEIQIVSYTANENAGLFACKNVSSLLLPRKAMIKFLAEIFQNGTTFTLEGIITQIINRFISTRTQICYGLSSLYERDAAGNTKPKNEKINIQNKKVDDQLRKIYFQQAKEEVKPGDLDVSTIVLDDIKFAMPKVSLTFDTLTSRKSGYEKTICRISVFDKNNNPFGSINTIMKNVYDKGVITVAAQLNKLRANYNSGLRISKDELKKSVKVNEKKKSRQGKQSQKITKEMFFQKSWHLIESLINEGKLVEISDGIYEIRDQFKLDTMKRSFKRIMPSLTYGTQNSAIIDATVSTVNEAKLNTIYMTRSDRAADNKNLIAAKVGFQKDLPLRVLPSQATVTIFGCPFVNFAQYIFLDFETGTTIDNAYAITGIKHDLTPGKFTTQLTLSYGDVYGKYENAAATLARTISDVVKPVPVRSAEADASTIRISSYSKSSKVVIGKTRSVYNKSISYDIKLPGESSGDFEKRYKPQFFLNIRPHKGNYCWIKKRSKSRFDLNIIYDIDEKQKIIELDLNLMKDTKYFDFVKTDDLLKKFKKEFSEKLKNNEFKSDKAKESNLISKIKLSNGVIIFRDNTNDFIQPSKVNNFINDLINKFLTIKLSFKFQTPNNSEGQINLLSGRGPRLTLGLDLDSKRLELKNLFETYSSVPELGSLIISQDYGNYIKRVLSEAFGESKSGSKSAIIKHKSTAKFKQYQDFRIDTKPRRKRPRKNRGYVFTGETTPTRGRKKTYTQHLETKFYLNEQKSPKFTTRGLELEIASGVASKSRRTKDNRTTVTIDLDYEVILISYKDLLEHILASNGFDLFLFFKP